MKLLTYMVSALLVSALAGCDDGDGGMDAGPRADSGEIDAGGGTDGGPMTDTGAGIDAGPLVCDISNHAVVFEFAEIYETDEYFVYGGQSGDTDPVDTVYLEMDSMDLTPLTHEFAGRSYTTCERCVTVGRNCTADVCAQYFLARTGTLLISTVDPVQDGSFVATLSNLVLDEVTIDETTFESTLVPGGEVWCIDAIDIDTTIDVITP